MKLTDVVDRINGNVDRFTTELEYYIGGEHFESNELEVTQKGLLKENLGKLGFKFHFAFQDRDVVFMARNPHLRKAGMVRFAGLCSDASYILRSKDETVLSQEYLAVMLQSDHFWDYCESHKVGSVNFANNWSSIANYEFELPTPEEQKEISDKVWAAYRLKKSYKKLLAATEEMVKSQFIEMFTDKGNPLTMIKSFADVSTGGTPSKAHPEYWNGDKPWVSAEDMKSKYVYDTCEKVTEEGYATCKIIPVDTLMYVCRGSIGVMAINKIECATNQSICRATCHNNVCNVEFLYHELMYQRDNIKKKGTGTSFKSLNQTTFSELEIELPPYNEQMKFVTIAEQADKSEFELRNSIDAIDAVIKSLINS